MSILFRLQEHFRAGNGGGDSSGKKYFSLGA
jgi:hypothetical protein